MKWIDVTRTLTNSTPTWPGDTPFRYEVSWSKEQSGSVNVGKLTMSIHTGTHVDAPFHFNSEGERIADLDVNLYVGNARIIDVSEKESVGASDLAGFNLKGVERLILKTNSWVNPDVFPDKITFLREDIGPFLHELGVKLIGLDVPSVDPLDSKELPAHHSLHQNGIHILESLQLDNMEPGDYELIALPLKIKDADGSPVRALLRPIGGI
ncbi:arylformamidase [Bacillus sp. 31A1R]|uniref:Kynurenine formamidase n=1 Tax=Robertmurraya mangrovi TaxID=3098077 RepID=A0ABU5J082_9BACI|nr:arylformamidase [Bacillus sp. 31A1R]MDZ5472806.1 arylformamidase [Bacillus sp. 31A1R]